MKKLVPAKVGASPMKLALLGGCVLILLWAYFSNRTPGGDAAPPAARGVAPQITDPRMPVRPVSRSSARAGRAGNTRLQEFRPSLKPKGEAELNRATIDPTLRLDLLEKLQDVKLEGGARSLFKYSEAPAAALAAQMHEPKKIVVPAFVGPVKPPPAPPVVEPPAPPIPLKFYGFINPVKGVTGPRRAFFLDGEDIIVAAEGQTVKSRYKIVRIGINSAVVEDTQYKNRQQTLPLVEEQAG
jgi:hypothetical protein